MAGKVCPHSYEQPDLCLQALIGCGNKQLFWLVQNGNGIF